MIKQHYYTREKRGIYSDNPGYDTVAKSMGLSDEFVKEVLHKYCFYEIPVELLNESNYDKFPKAFTVFNIPSGEMIIGRTSFVPKDFEGKRSTFFTHNYVLGRKEKEEFIKNPDKIIYVDGFKNSYNIAYGGVLEDIRSIEMESMEMGFSSFQDLLTKLKIEENTFKEIVMACFISVLQNRKIYIILDVDVSMLSFYAKELLKFIYRSLPYAVREKLGFITYTKDYKSREFIHIEFVSRSGIKSINTDINAGYLFDFVRDRFLKEGIKTEQHEYLDFVVRNMKDTEKINDFIEKVSNFCLDSLNINEYDDFCKILLTSEEEAAFRNDEEGKIKLFESITKNEKLLTEFIRTNKQNEKVSKSLREYANYLIEKCTNFEEYFQIVEFCFIISSKFIGILAEELEEKSVKLFSPSICMANEFVFADEKISMLKYKHKNEELKNFLNDILEGLFTIFINTVQPEFMSISSIEKINLLPQNVDSENYEIISVLKKVVNIKNFDDAAYVGVAIQDSKYRNKIEKAITSAYKISINNENYLKITCGFLNSTGCDINGVINYVWENGEIKEAREFVIWLCSMYEKLFSKQAEHDLKKALLNYFENLDLHFFQDAETRDKLIKESEKGIRAFIIREDKSKAKGIRKLKITLSKIFQHSKAH
ncbi:GAP1-N2 domain-containing protein [Clostridium guangxiense]|uniref:GAP1-N2 domain-containing protein n=1 Tax=Clostridium guangxiense TaxID=1662055 RepID=UPI001E60D8F4|nr:hypothetical protein [Clostridium guangxiense]MCD2347927.1 hypothetical protein [Clostridium guangxiense]